MLNHIHTFNSINLSVYKIRTVIMAQRPLCERLLVFPMYLSAPAVSVHHSNSGFPAKLNLLNFAKFC